MRKLSRHASAAGHQKALYQPLGGCMKQFVTRTLTSLLLIVVWAAGSAYAQSSAVIRVNIPFDFSVGSQDFPAGKYSVVQPLQHFVVLRNDRGQSIAAAFTSGL